MRTVILKNPVYLLNGYSVVGPLEGKGPLKDYFDYILCGDQVTKRKPHPETYLKVLDYFKVDSKQTLVLEDSLVGVEAAYRAGTMCIMIPDLIAPTKKQENQTIAIVKTMHEVISMIE